MQPKKLGRWMTGGEGLSPDKEMDVVGGDEPFLHDASSRSSWHSSTR